MTVPFQLAQKLMEWVRWGQYASSILSLSFSVSKMGVTVKNGETLTCQDSGKTGEVRSTMVKLPAVPARPGHVGLVFPEPVPEMEVGGQEVYQGMLSGSSTPVRNKGRQNEQREKL